MGVTNVSMKDGLVDVYIDYVPIIKEMNLLEDKKILTITLYASQTEILNEVLGRDDFPNSLDVYIDKILIPYQSETLEDWVMDLAIKFSIDLDFNTLEVLVSFGESPYLGIKKRKYVLVEAKYGVNDSWRSIAEFHGTDNYPYDKGISCPMRKPGKTNEFYTSEDYKKRIIHPALREFIRSPLEEKDYIGGGEESLLFYTHLSNLEEILKFAVIRSFI